MAALEAEVADKALGTARAPVENFDIEQFTSPWSALHMARSRRRIGWDEGRWRSDAACSGVGADLFFPAGERDEEAAAQIHEAKGICACCPVRLHCLAFALSTRQEDGTWGGLTPSERRSLRRRRAARRQARALRASDCSGVS